jgi:serine/threonine-protein kinase
LPSNEPSEKTTSGRTGQRRTQEVATVEDPVAGQEAPEDVPFPVGTIVADTYEILGLLGEGAMGHVFHAYDRRLDRPVALKAVKTKWLSTQARVERFENEARAMARVRNEHVIEIFASGSHEKVPYFVMRLVDGQTLDDWLRRRRFAPASVDEVFGIMSQICAGVEAIHAAGTTHRDLKPSNVLIDRDFRVSVVDLGLAEVLGAAIRAHSASVAGTPAFMAPELWGEQELAADLAPRADIYALGHCNVPAPPPSELRPELPEPIDELILEALHKQPAQRCPSVRVFREKLARARDSARGGAFAGRTVYLVNADPSVSAMAEQALVLSMPGVEITAIDTRDELERCIQRGAPDVLVLDLDVEWVDAVAVLEELLLHRSQIRPGRVVLLSGATGAGRWRELYTRGADVSLQKPLHAPVLARLVRALMPV